MKISVHFGRVVIKTELWQTTTSFLSLSLSLTQSLFLYVSFALSLPPLSLYIYIYIVIHRQICFVLSELISVARRARFPKLGTIPGWLKRQSKILPLSHDEACDSEVILNGYESQLLLFAYIRLTATQSSIHAKSLAYTVMATQLLHSLESSTLQG